MGGFVKAISGFFMELWFAENAKKMFGWLEFYFAENAGRMLWWFIFTGQLNVISYLFPPTFPFLVSFMSSSKRDLRKMREVCFHITCTFWWKMYLLSLWCSWYIFMWVRKLISIWLLKWNWTFTFQSPQPKNRGWKSCTSAVRGGNDLVCDIV